MFSNEERDSIYKVIYNRRYSKFLSTPIPENIIHRILNAAHHAPSVGFKQPWNFILISTNEIKEKLAWAAEKPSISYSL